MSSYFEHFVAEAEAGMRLDTVLGTLDFLPSRTAGARLIEGGLVLVDGEAVSKKHTVKSGEHIEIEVPDHEPSDLVPEHIDLDIRYEDEYLIVLSKPAGLVVHPSQGHWTGTLVHALLAHADELGTMQGADRPGIVHRLDKDTSGLMVVAKNDQVQVALQEAIKVRAVDRRYLALVHGWIAPDTGLVDAPIARDMRDRMRMTVSDREGARQSVTTFTVLERFDAGTYDDGFTLLECKLYTGRTHQIRVHMAYIKHPCVGDQLYGSGRLKADLGLERQFLHSYRLKFKHPITGEQLGFTDPPSAELATRLKQIAEFSVGRTDAGREAAELLVALSCGQEGDSEKNGSGESGPEESNLEESDLRVANQPAN
ncbi:MAG: RluA family pseudouridine synthase [Coriobacteriia bacterium]|nr:RluA family pseudouridine synthase [Coriobacteriia bacterium]